MYDRAAHAFRGVLLTSILISTAWGGSSPVSPTEKKPPDERLQSQGLRRVGTAYLLPAEDDLKTKQAALRRDYRDWEHLRSRVDQLREDVNKKRGYLANLETQRRVLLTPPPEPHKTDSRQSRGTPPPPGEFGPPPDGFRLPPIPGSFAPHPHPHPHPEFDPDGPMRPGRDRDNRAQQIQKVEHQMIQARSQLIQGQILERRLSAQARKKQGEIQRRVKALGRLVDSVSKRYAELAGDTVVVQAIDEINQTSRPRVALGPVEDTKANLAKMAAEFPGSKDEPAPDKGEGTDLGLGTDADVRMLGPLIELLQKELGGVLIKQQGRRHEALFREKRLGILLATEKQLESGPVGDTAAQKEQVAAQLKSVKDQIKRSRDEADRSEKASEELTVQISVLREAFLACVAALRSAADRGPLRPESPAVDDKIGRAVADSRENKNPQKPPRVSPQQRALLEDAEKKIHTEIVPLEPDKTVLWVDTILNGKSDQRMVLDPDAGTIRVSARFAAAFGIPKDENGPAVPVAMSDRKTLVANPARIASLQVGPFTLNDVECLILPEGYDTPPVLGASFLDHFTSKVDFPAAQLTLVRVDLKPAHTRTAP